MSTLQHFILACTDHRGVVAGRTQSIEQEGGKVFSGNQILGGDKKGKVMG
jgi:hypothetical protein